MSAADLLNDLINAGLDLTMDSDGRISVTGDQETRDMWIGIILENKPELIQELRHRQILGMLVSDPDKRYAILVNDAAADPVVVAVGIRGQAVFDLTIPQDRYDGVALLQEIDRVASKEELGNVA